MADLSNTSPWIGAGQGIAQGIQNAGAIQGMMQRKEEMDRESGLADLRKKALETTVATGEVQQKEAAMKLKEMEQSNTPMDYGIIEAHDPDKIASEYRKNLLQQNGWLAPDGQVLQKHLVAANTMMQHPTAVRDMAVLTIDSIDKQLQELNKPLSATGQNVTPEQRAAITTQKNQLTEKKTRLMKLNGMHDSAKWVNVFDENGNSRLVDENTNLDIEGMANWILSDVQKEKIKEKAAADLAVARERGRNDRATAANISRANTATERINAIRPSQSERSRAEIDALLNQQGQAPTTIPEWLEMQGRMHNALDAWGPNFRGGWKPSASGSGTKKYQQYTK